MYIYGVHENSTFFTELAKKYYPNIGDESFAKREKFIDVIDKLRVPCPEIMAVPKHYETIKKLIRRKDQRDSSLVNTNGAGLFVMLYEKFCELNKNETHQEFTRLIRELFLTLINDIEHHCLAGDTHRIFQLYFSIQLK